MQTDFVVGLPRVQFQSASGAHDEDQPSPLTVLSSSQ
jgi:hypothetical protein